MGSGRLWTIGLAWGILAWIPFFLKISTLLELTLGLPVILSGFLTYFLESITGPLPDSLSFSLSLPAGIATSWLIHALYQLMRDTWWDNISQNRKQMKLGKGVE